MIEYINGDITETHLHHIIHGCNAKGVMGSGVALSIKTKWIGAYYAYMAAYHSKNGVALGDCVSYHTKDEKIIGNLITQENYGRDKNIKYARRPSIQFAIHKFIAESRKGNAKKLVIASSKIGCGLGGLDWETEVLPIYQDLGNYFNTDFLIYDNGVKLW